MAHLDLISDRIIAQLLNKDGKWIATLDVVMLSNADIVQLLELGYRINIIGGVGTSKRICEEILEHIEITGIRNKE
jgi:hypothetical protein